MEPLLKNGERIDDLQRNNLRIIQNKDGFCFGMDAVLLTGFAAASKFFEELIGQVALTDIKRGDRMSFEKVGKNE